jgi:hypothetical protein
MSQPAAPSPLPDIITITGSDGIQYEIQMSSSKAYIVTTEKTYSNLFWILVITLAIAVVYDYGKDLMRTFSGYKDVYHGRSGSGVAKLHGLTKANIIRGVVKVALLFAVFIVFKKMTTRTEIAFDKLPLDVGIKLLGELKKYSTK